MLGPATGRPQKTPQNMVNQIVQRTVELDSDAA
jgi:hypothetical protein